MSDKFLIPKPSKVLELDMIDGAKIIVRQHGNLHGPRIVMSHGNGFAIDAYFPFWSRLLQDYELCLYDQRSHGWNPRHNNLVHHDVPYFTSDMERVLMKITEHFGDKPTAGIFHSISAITSFRHALEFKWCWDALVLFDPPFVMPPMHSLHNISQDFELKMAEWSMNRPEFFKSPDHLAQQFRSSKSLSRWITGSHELMAKTILRHQSNKNQWGLCCPPAGESRVYSTNASINLTPYFRQLRGPFKIIASDPDDPNVRSPGLVNRDLHNTHQHEYEAISGTTHMLQLEKPVECAGAVKDFFSSVGFYNE